MANYNTTANVVLSVNGKQAQQMLSTLQREASNLEKKIAKAATAGDKATMRKLQRELSNTNRMINQLQGSATTADQVLRRLDKASPKELNKTLKTLQSQLNGIQRGTAAWDAHVAKIKAVKKFAAKILLPKLLCKSRFIPNFATQTARKSRSLGRGREAKT